MRKIIYTVSVGKSICFKHCIESQQRYAKKIGVEFYVSNTWKNWNNDLKTDSDKRHIVQLLKNYDKVLYLDADVFIKEDSPDIFEFYKENNKLIIYNEIMYNNVNMDKYIQKCVDKYNIEWKKTNNHYDWLNAGVMLCSKGHERVFNYDKEDFFKFEDMPMIYDMPYMHKNIYDNNIQVEYLDKRFNTMVYFEDNGYFLHFANVLDRDKRILNYV